jgi:superoxide dismutase, Fe-Mn family
MAVYTLPELDYDYAALEPHLAARIVELHHDKHHATYVGGANAAGEKLEQARGEGSFDTIDQLEKNLAFNVSGHVLHSLLWKNMAPGAGGEPEGELAAAIGEQLGGREAFRAQFEAVALGVQGSGWSVLAWEPLAGRLVVEQVYDHQSNVGQGSVPLLVLDMWEHAFYLQYENVKADWVKAFWNLVNWDDVGARFAKVRGFELL